MKDWPLIVALVLIVAGCIGPYKAERRDQAASKAIERGQKTKTAFKNEHDKLHDLMGLEHSATWQGKVKDNWEVIALIVASGGWAGEKGRQFWKGKKA